MTARTFRTVAIAVVAIGLCDAAFAAGSKRPRHRLAAPYADPAASSEANRLSARRRPELDTPGQTTVLTRETLDDMNATTLKGALRSTAGVTIGR